MSRRRCRLPCSPKQLVRSVRGFREFAKGKAEGETRPQGARPVQRPAGPEAWTVRCILFSVSNSAYTSYIHQFVMPLLNQDSVQFIIFGGTAY
jgi:hypothetical protein